LHIDFDSVRPARASSVTASASVTDVNRQTWSSETTLLVHPSDLYVGLKSDKTFVEKGEPLVVQSIVTDLDGKLVGGRAIKMVATRLAWQQTKGEWTQVESDPQECAIQSSAGNSLCTFQTKEGGEYRVKASIRDDRERLNESELRLWVSGVKTPSTKEVEEEDVELIPDRKEYKVGDTAQILVQAPFYPAEGVMTLQRSGIVKVERFRMDGPTTTLRVSVEQDWSPNVYLQVDLVGSAEREMEGSAKPLVKRPAYASGFLKLLIPPLDRRLTVIASPRDKALEPGGETSVNVEVKDATGAPVTGGEVAVVVVDEAVLALSDYKLDDPVSVFYSERAADVEDVHLRENVLLSTPAALFAASREVAGGTGGGQGMFSVTMAKSDILLGRGGLPAPPNQSPSVSLSGPGAPEPLRVRQNFNALAVFAPSVPTDTNGRAEVKVKLPDNLTRYRVMAVAVAGGKQFGSGESSITARMPLMVRASAPRFLNFGDAFEFPIVVQNQTDNSMSVDVALRASNASLSSLAGRRVSVPANDRVEVRIPVSTSKAGTAHFQVAATSGRWSDAAEVSLPVWTPATTEAFATYGEVDQGVITQPVKAPADVFKQFGGLEIEASSTQLQQLTDAFLYLHNYPYECSEQLASRILSVAALRDVLTEFKAKDLPPKAEIEASVIRDVNRLAAMQNNDGGFGFWKRGDESWPFLSIHVAHALARARQNRFPVPVNIYDRAQKYLREIDRHIPSRYGVDTKRALNAYALYVRAQMGDRDTQRARRLLAEPGVEKLSLEAIGWLLTVLSGDEASRTQVETLRNNLKNRVAETASTAHFVSSYQDDDHLVLNSNRRADAVILEALIADQPANDLIPKIVRGLLDHRIQGRWSSTQENVFILLALDRYFKTYEKVTPDFVARVWLGDAFAGEQQFKGRSVDRKQVNVPMSFLTGAQNLVMSKEGPGRLYYRLAMNYAPSNLNLKSADYGFAVERTYEAVDTAEDVRRDADGTWVIKAGARVRVRVTMATPSRRYHVALVDPLPAGFETLNPELAVTEKIPEDKKQEAVVSYGSRSFGFGWWTWRSVWFDHQNLRDERSEAFTSLLWEGVYDYSYVVRATTPGLFVVPPSKAEEMYHPETFGRSGSDRVRVK
jgi:alpha-2-macroglobulin